MKRHPARRLSSAVAIAALLGIAVATPSLAADKVLVGSANGLGWTFTPASIGNEVGIFARYGIEVEVTGLAGDAKVQAALISSSIDFGLGSGPALAVVAKGAPVIGVAAFAAEPRQISLVILPDSPIKTIADVKGKTLGISTLGSLTEWLGDQMAIQEGWGKGGVKMLALGDTTANQAAMRTHQIDGWLGATETGYTLEEKHEGRVFQGMEKYAPHFQSHVIFARKEMVANNPDLVNRFLKGFFASIAFMKANRAKTTELASQILHESPAIADKTYEHEIGMLEDDGHFDPQAIAVLAASFVDMGVLPEKPRDDQMFTTQFVPVKP